MDTLTRLLQNLRTANSAADRAAAARTLGLVGSQRATADLIAAAMFDDAAEVREAAEEALTQISNPTVTKAPMNEMPMTETTPLSQIVEASIQDIAASLAGMDETSHHESGPGGCSRRVAGVDRLGRRSRTRCRGSLKCCRSRLVNY